jgi:SAM-dependent methyltransferase
LAISIFTRWRNGWDSIHEEHSTYLEQLPARWTTLAIVATSALALYTELLIVRWHATCFHAFAIFKNVSMLSCFLGLGIGFGLSSKRRSTLAAFLPLLALQVVLFGVLSATNLGGRRINPVGEQLIMGTSGIHWSWLDAVEGNAFLAMVFVLNAVMFVPLGQLAGRLMERLPRVQSYALNLLGSLLGIGLFFALSLAWTGPSVWMGVVLLLLTPFVIGDRRSVAITVASAAVILIGQGLMRDRREQTFYSPYQVIALRLPSENDTLPTPSIQVNHCFYQDVLDCSPHAVASSERNATAAEYYNLPYRLQQRPGDVLVVGAGTGNDVAAALRHAAVSVTAVEIDPAILHLGKKLHPERVYQDPRTKAVVNDARSFLRQTDKRFDTIVYGLLDSHTNLGAMTNVRLDSFVYTVEGFRDAVRRLSSDGLLVVSYLVLDPAQGDKLFAMLKQADPQRTPRAFAGKYGGTTYVTGPGLDRLADRFAGVEEITTGFVQRLDKAEVSTDDWPFFYMKKRTYPISYAIMVGLLLVLSAVMIRGHLDTSNLLTPSAGVFFFLGAGFMLIETKAITELGLVFGNTWAVMAIVITCILLMGFAANLVVLFHGPVDARWSYGLLGGALALGLLVTRLSSAGVYLPLPWVVMPLVLTLPLFFAGLIFSSSLASGSSIGGIMAANIFGAMLGGFLEYNSMFLGFSSLYPLGMALYGLAFGCYYLNTRLSKTGQPLGKGSPTEDGAPVRLAG